MLESFNCQLFFVTKCFYTYYANSSKNALSASTRINIGREFRITIHLYDVRLFTSATGFKLVLCRWYCRCIKEDFYDWDVRHSNVSYRKIATKRYYINITYMSFSKARIHILLYIGPEQNDHYRITFLNSFKLFSRLLSTSH